MMQAQTSRADPQPEVSMRNGAPEGWDGHLRGFNELEARLSGDFTPNIIWNESGRLRGGYSNMIFSLHS